MSYMPEFDETDSHSGRRLMEIGKGFGMAFEKLVRVYLNRLYDEIVELQSYHPDADPYLTFKMFHKIVSNLIANPNEPKFKKLKKSNKKVNTHLLRYQAAQEILSFIGFRMQFDTSDDSKMESEEIDTRDSVWVFRKTLSVDSQRILLLDAVQIQSEQILYNLKRKRQQPAEVILEAIRRAPAGLRFLLQSSEDKLPDTRQFMGIKNIGSVCYLNSMIQVLFFNALFRRLIFSVERPEDGDVDQVKDDAKHIIYTLQEFFYFLFTRRKVMSVDPTMLLKAFGWYGDQRFEQRDVNEFQMAFMDKIEEGLKGLDAYDEFYQAFYGKEAVRNFSDEVGYQSRQVLPFSLITLQLTGATHLEEALAGYLEGTENVEINVDGHGRTECKQQWELKKIPPILHFHLQRFELDRETWQQLKRHDRLEFELEFDMSAYVSEDDVQEGAFEYELYGVLVHSGTTNAGHYWAYVRCCVVENGCEREAWYFMNDTQVEETTWETVQEYSFGQGGQEENDGENTVVDDMKSLEEIDPHEAWKKQLSSFFGTDEYGSFLASGMAKPSPKFSSAYMLIYVAKRARDRILCPLESDYTLPSFHDLQTAIAKSESLRRAKYQDGVLLNEELLRRGLQPKQLCLCGKCLQKRKAQFT